MATDSRLQSLQNELEDLHRKQADARKEIERLEKARDAKVEQIRREYDSDITNHNRKYSLASSRLPEITRQISSRQREIEIEEKRKAASASTTDTPARRSSW